MRYLTRISLNPLILASCIFFLPMVTYSASQDALKAVVAPKVFEIAKKNANWKTAFYTGKDAQVVFMNITPVTNPKNEIGMETHPFDQVIIVVQGKAKAILDGKVSVVNVGDMIFIPQGIPHNFINTSKTNPFKIISVYSSTDIPEHAAYAKKSDMPAD